MQRGAMMILRGGGGGGHDFSAVGFRGVAMENSLQSRTRHSGGGGGGGIRKDSVKNVI